MSILSRPMVCALLVLSLVTVSLLAAPLSAQSKDEQIDQLRILLKALEKQFDTLQSAPEEPADKKITRIGASRTSRGDDDQEPRMLVKLYELSDLFAVAPSYQAQLASDLSSDPRAMFPQVQSQIVAAGFGGGGGGFGGGGGGGGFFNVQQAPQTTQPPTGQNQTLRQMGGGVDQSGGNLSAARTSIDELIDAITSTISPDQWDTAGGPASIATLGRSLLISADESTHDQIAELFSLFRQRWGSLRSVTVEAHWLWLTERQLATLVNHRDAAAMGQVDDQAWQQILQRKDDRRAGYHAVVSCYNGQTVHTLAGGQSVAVTGVTPVVAGGSQGSVGYQPTVSIVQQGAALQVTPLVGSSGKHVVLDIHSRVNQLQDAPAEAPAAKKTDSAAVDQIRSLIAVIDRRTLMASRLSTTLRIPLDRTVLVGGSTFQSAPEPDDPNLYLFVKVSAQDLTDEVAGAAEAEAEEAEDSQPAPNQDPPARQE